MREWLARQIPAATDRAVLVIDRFGIASDVECAGNPLEPARVVRTADWYELRRTWEHHGRHAGRIGPVVIVVSDAEVASPFDLPYDISRGAVITTIRIPGSAAIRDVLLALDDAQSDQAATLIEAGDAAPEVAVIAVAAQLPSHQLALLRGPDQFRAAIRLRTRNAPDPVVELARSVFDDPLAQALLSDPPQMRVVQDAWRAFATGDAADRWISHFDEAPGEIAGMLLSGMLQPVATGRADLPAWATIGIADVDAAERVASLLDTTPDAAACVSLDDWVAVAQWWAQVRHGLAVAHRVAGDLAERAWQAWGGLDVAFRSWLRGHYGAQLSRSWGNGPASADKVQPFLAYQRQPGERLLLIVLDGCGLTQWAHIVDAAPIRVVRPGAALAMIPTLTSVSRQAIAAGATPVSFADSIDTTSKESERWRAAWHEDGVKATWHRIDGAHVDELDGIPFSTSDVVGLVVSATDELMHGAELLGDVGFHAGMEAWLAAGVIGELVSRACAHGFSVWVTADHGNLEVVLASSKREGVFVDRSGTRVRRYQNRTIRDASEYDGETWDDIPGLPADEAERLLFAPGRTGWGRAKVSHGGLSLDEVIVPFVQVAAL